MTITYDLREKKGNSNLFYKKLHGFSEKVVNVINEEAGPILHGYSKFIKENLDEKYRSHEEYAIEFLTLGLLWHRYTGAAHQSSKVLIILLRGLFKLRKRIPKLKPFLDPIRGKLAGTFLVTKIGTNSVNVDFNCDSLKRLIAFLEATGEFKDEVLRLTNWYSFLYSLPKHETQDALKTSVDLFKWFALEAQKVLGTYTANVDSFLSSKYVEYRYREDEIFCGKESVEYHLNMIGSEVMNWGLCSEFLKAKKRAVLVPGCMRGERELTCKAKINGLDIVCTGCTDSCNIKRISEIGSTHNFEVFIVPHSTSFSHWLQRWKNTTEYSVVAVACALNIIVGGYEMRSLNIPSQCVMLDYCGCRKHWHDTGIATNFNLERLLKLVSEGSSIK